ncbi:MAG: protease [Thermoproteota archaeon]|nr:MAG: protease [Candidatus Korarchaeota archaeon]
MLREALLMGFLTALLMAMGLALGYYFGNPSQWLLAGLILSAIFNAFAYAFSDRIVLAMTGARLVSESEMPMLHRIVERISLRAGIPKPKVALVPTHVPNAFATGRGPKNATVAVTEGLINVLNEREIEAVLGHELAHVLHRDTLVSAMAATIAGAISYLAYLGRWGLFFGGSREERDSAPVLAAALSLILVPIAATLIRLAISREREYKADEEGARITGRPIALSNALIKIREAVTRLPPFHVNPGTTHLWIVNPLKGESIVELFSTHPSVEKRVLRLRQLADEMGVWDDRPISLETLRPRASWFFW